MSSQRDAAIDWVPGLGERCGAEGNCPSRRYYWNDDGQKVCSRGHVQEGIIQTYTAEDEFAQQSSQGQVSRIRKEVLEKKSRFVTGIAALNLFLSCYQHILRLQCTTLIKSKGFPVELEVITKDLWSLRLPRIHDKIGSRLGGDYDDGDGDDDGLGSKMYSSQTESTGDNTDAEETPRRERRRELPSLVDSLALCYIAMMLLRCPVSSGELHRWAIREEIPFIRPLRMIEDGVKRNLSTRWINLLETHHTLKEDDLNDSIRRLIYQYHRYFGLSLPNFNYQPVLYWYVHELAIPLQIYTIVLRLASVLSLQFSFPTAKLRHALHDPLPELVVAALVVIAVKLYHPFDSETYYARSVTDPSYLKIDWEHWTATRQSETQTNSKGRPFLPGEQMSVREHDAFDLNAEQLDSYMDWFESTWTTPARNDIKMGELSQGLLDMFLPPAPSHKEPLHSPQKLDDVRKQAREAHTERLSSAVKDSRPRAIISNERAEHYEQPVKRVGSAYKAYNSEEDLDGYAKDFHEAIAERAAVTVGRLLRTVSMIESKILKWKRNRRAQSSEDVDSN